MYNVILTVWYSCRLIGRVH